METRWDLRASVLKVLQAMCVLDGHIVSILLASVLPMELARYALILISVPSHTDTKKNDFVWGMQLILLIFLLFSETCVAVLVIMLDLSNQLPY